MLDILLKNILYGKIFVFLRDVRLWPLSHKFSFFFKLQKMSQKQVLMKVAEDILEQLLTDVIGEVAQDVLEPGARSDDDHEVTPGSVREEFDNGDSVVQIGAACTSQAPVMSVLARSLFSVQDSGDVSEQDSSPSKTGVRSTSRRSPSKLDTCSTPLSDSSCSPDLKFDKSLSAGPSRRESSWSPPRSKDKDSLKNPRHSSSSPTRERRTQAPRSKSTLTRQSSSSPAAKPLQPNPTKRRKSDLQIQDSDTTEDEMRANAMGAMGTPNSPFFLLIHCEEMTIHNCHHLQAILEGVGDYKGREGYDEKGKLKLLTIISSQNVFLGLFYELAFDTRATMMTWLGHLKFMGFGEKTNSVRSRLTFTEG